MIAAVCMFVSLFSKPTTFLKEKAERQVGPTEHANKDAVHM